MCIECLLCAKTTCCHIAEMEHQSYKADGPWGFYPQIHLGSITHALLEIDKAYQQLAKGFEKPFGKNNNLALLVFQT